MTETKKCPYCAEIISSEAIKCKHCGEMLDSSNRMPLHQTIQIVTPASREQKWSPGVAAVLSFFFPGLGHLYKGEIGTGILWFIFVVIGYFFFVIPGLILHLICIVRSASSNSFD